MSQKYAKVVRINFQSYSRGEIRLQRLDMHDTIYSQHIRRHKIYIYVTMEDIYIIYVFIFTYTYHISVLSKLRLDVCCRMSLQTSIREACIAGQRRPKECRALLLYQSSAHISGHLTWMKSERWISSHRKT